MSYYNPHEDEGPFTFSNICYVFSLLNLIFALGALTKGRSYWLNALIGIFCYLAGWWRERE